MIDATGTSEIPAERAFPEAEYDARGSRPHAPRWTAPSDVLLVHSLPNICYLTGFQTPLSDCYHCLVLPRDGEPVLQVCDPELAAMNTYVTTLLPVSWENMDEAADQLADHLASVGAAKSRIGVEMRRPGLNPFTEHRLATRLPLAMFVDANDLVLRVRAVKSPAEMAHLREAARLSTLGKKRRSPDSCFATETTSPFAMHAIVTAGGILRIDPIVRAGRRSCHACDAPRGGSPRPVLMEIGGVYQVLRACRRHRNPPERLQRLADTSLRAMDRHSRICTRCTMGDVASAACRRSPTSIRPSGCGLVGYAIGIGFPPSWVSGRSDAVGRTDVLEPNDVPHASRVAGAGCDGRGLQRKRRHHQDGHERLTHFPRQLGSLSIVAEST